MSHTPKHRRNISKGLKARYKADPELRERAAAQSLRNSRRMSELVAFGRHAEAIDRDNRELGARNQILAAKLVTAQAKHQYQVKRIQELELEVNQYWELYQAALGPVGQREVDL